MFVALCLIGAAAAYGYVRHQLGNVTHVSVSSLTKASGPMTILIIGSDSRNIPGNDGAYGSAAQTPGQRSDTIMLARVVPKTHAVTLLSIPRDLYVNIAGIGQSRINSAFNNGPNLLISTIQHDLGIPVNHFVEINFDTFQSITDAVGGVKVWFPTPAKDYYSGLRIPAAGCVNLTGAQALGFARSRHYEYELDGQWITQGLSDLARIQRQQFYVKKMIAKAEGSVTNPFALNRILTGVTKNLTVDTGFGTGLMLSLAQDLRTADVAGIPTLTLPTFNEVIGGADVLGLQQPQAEQMIESFNAIGEGHPAQRTTATTTRSSHVAVEVANGSGVAGQAGDAVTGLDRLGYRATVQAQSPGYDFTQSDIEYAPDARTDAEQLQAQIGGGATLTESPALTPTPYSLELVTGSGYSGIAGETRPSHARTSTTRTAGTTKATTPPTTAPAGSAPVTNYLLPGPSPTEAELAAC